MPEPASRSTCRHCGSDIEYRTWIAISPLERTEGWIHTATDREACSVAEPVSSGASPTLASQAIAKLVEGAEERRQQPAVPDDLGRLQDRLDELRAARTEHTPECAEAGYPGHGICDCPCHVRRVRDRLRDAPDRPEEA